MAKKLYGTDPDQVPTNADLGTMAYQDNGNVNVDKITVSRNNAVEGAIGVSTSIDGTLYIAGDSGIQFRSDDILPTDSSGAYTGGVLDIGDDGARFRAIYLSDGVNFGDAGGSGTSTSNTLDSYEEGTWTPVDASPASLTLTTSVAVYTKIGNLVKVSASVTYPSTADTNRVHISGLPFALAAGASGGAYITFTNCGSVPMFISGGTSISAYTAAGGMFANSTMSTDRIDFVVIYTTT